MLLALRESFIKLSFYPSPSPKNSVGMNTFFKRKSLRFLWIPTELVQLLCSSSGWKASDSLRNFSDPWLVPSEQWCRIFRPFAWQPVETCSKSGFFENRHSTKHFARKRGEDERLSSWKLIALLRLSEHERMLLNNSLQHPFCWWCSAQPRLEKFQLSGLNSGAGRR